MTAVHNPSPSAPCEERLAKIYTYIDDPLSCQDLEELQAHLSECETCTKEYDLECIIRQAVRRTCKETAPVDLKSRIRACIDDIHTGGHPATN
ncbi:mycothiol system anti-sigma-R factor [Rothia sp. SD9660Na]|uniref:mycothiol system anti-sigma-R factor n=1 Tax=Rothia sp. SD9660Na TaxID=3047030 RepID=UPI0024B9B08F|nr:mycothiol system anti-sigma-R factor [Rothia sp. SD9660Na]WHS51129.1 mycothiol system anti-sigma-R factor [Rothia sp. SD9660Na]